MRKERIKSILLVFFILTDFVLGSKILIDKKLWPNGYNFFSNVGNFYSGIISYFSDNSSERTQIFSPEKILINTGDQTTRISLNSNDNGFFELYSEAEKLLKSAFSKKSDSIVSVSKEELYQALSSESVYLNYPVVYKTDLFSDILGVKKSDLSSLVNSFSHIVITHSPTTAVYIADFEAENFKRVNLTKNADALKKLCTEYSKFTSQRPVINYSFDLKFDEPFGTQKTTLNPLIEIYSTVPDYPSIVSANPVLDYEASFNNAMIDDILEIFGINPRTINRYPEADGTVVFVENNSILKISPDGLLEYELTSSGVEKNEKKSEYQNILDVYDVASKINSVTKNNADIRLSQTGNSEYHFDYTFSGLNIHINNKRISSGICAKTEDGRLKSYSQLLRTYSPTGNSSIPSEFFLALDTAITEYSEFMNEIKINKMHIGYTDDGTISPKYANWIVEVDNVIAGT